MARSAQTKKRRKQSPERPSVKTIPRPAKVPISASTWWKWIGGGLFIFAATFVAFWPSVYGGFYNDDNFYIQHNPLLDDPDRLWKAWFVPGSFIEYYPIEQTLQWMLYQQFGQEPFGYHVVNIVLHGLNAIAVWYFLGRLKLRFAWWGGLIYAVYPLFVESVGYISEFKNALSVIPFIASMCFYIDFERTGKSSDYKLSLTFFIIAMMCKISMVCFPLVLPLYAWYLRGRVTRQDLVNCAPFAVVAVVLAGLSIYSGSVYAVTHHEVPPGAIPIGGGVSRTALVGLTTAFYLTHPLLPMQPLALYPMWPIDPPTPIQFLPWLLLALGGWYLWTRRNDWGRPVILAVGAFLLFMVPTLGFHDISYMCLTFVQDHFLYIPMIFLLALVVAGMDGIYRQMPAAVRPALVAIPAIIVAAMAVETHSFAKTFSSYEDLFAYDVEHDPGSWYARSCYGIDLVKAGHVAEALPQLEASVQLNPHFSNARAALGFCYQRMGNLPAAESNYRETIKIAPNTNLGYLELAALLNGEGRLAEATQVLQDELTKIPDDSMAYVSLGQVAMHAGHPEQAAGYYRSALQIEPQNQDAIAALERLNPPNAPPK